MQKTRKKIMWNLLGPLLLLVLLASAYLAQVLDSSLRTKNGFDILALRVKAAADHDPVPRPFSVLVLGDSTAFFNLNPLTLPNATSMAASNANIRESYYTLRRLLSRGARPYCVLASFSFQWPDADEYFWSMFVRNGFYSTHDLGEIYAAHVASHSDLTEGGRFMFWLRVFLYRTKILGGSIERIRSLLMPDRETERLKAGFKLTLEAGHGWPDADTWRPPVEANKKFSELPRNTAVSRLYSKKLKMLLKQHGITLYLLDVPLPSSYTAEERREYERAYGVAAAGLLGRDTTRRVRVPPLPESDFFRAGHLLRRGSQKIMPILQQTLQSCARQNSG